MAVAGMLLVLFLVIVFVISIIRYNQRSVRYEEERRQLRKQFELELLQSKLETQEETLHHMATELHDNIAQLLGSARMMLGLASRKLALEPLRSADETLERAIQEIRMLSKSLNREWLHQFSVLRNMEVEVDRLNGVEGVRLHLQAPVHELPLGQDAQLMLFRIIQEALQNAIRHADASNINIQFAYVNEKVEVCVSDDGKGFELSVLKQNGIGMMNMKNRVQLLQGTIKWHSELNKGTQVHISLPVKYTV